MTSPAVVRLNRKRCVLFGTVHGSVGLIVLVMTGVPLAFGIFDSLLVAGAAVGLFFAALGVRYFGLAYRNPVALRMDAGGISGIYADPAGWKEIKSVKPFTTGRSHWFLGFELHNPVGFRERQTPLRRYQSWSFGRRHGVHLVIPQAVLRQGNVAALAQQAERMLEDNSNTPNQR